MIPKIDSAVVGRRLRRLRKARGITQEQVAEDLGVTVAFISNLENNRAKINLRIAIYYSNLLDVTIDYLLFSPDDSDLPDAALEQQIMLELQHYTAEEKKMILKALHAMKK